MTAASTRTLKETRALLFPWCTLMLLSTFPLFTQPGQFLYFLSQAGLLIGIPLLACLSFGNEFRHKTMELLVSQPVSRLTIWREKWVVAATAILTTCLVAIISSRTPLHIQRHEDLHLVMFLMITSCSASFWTLFAKSTLGGLMLNIATVVPLGLANVAFSEWDSSVQTFNETGVILVLSAATLGYSAVMLWLGRWMLVRRQSGPGFAGSDVMAAIPSLMPGSLASLLRCRPHQPFLNLIRKELQLLRPLWLISTFYVLGWSAIAIASSFSKGVGDRHQAMLVLIVIGTASYPVIAMFLAAALPFAEEGTYGTQLWHLTLPLSTKRQWLLRLVTGLLAGLICGFGLSSGVMALAHALLPSATVPELVRMAIPIPVPELVMFYVLVFWCAVISRDLARSAALTVVAAAMLGLASAGGHVIADWVSERSIDLATFLISRFQLNPSTFNFGLGWFPNLDAIPGWVLMAAVCVGMALHTYPLFRRLPREGGLKMIRPLGPYLAAILVFVPLATVHYWKGFVTEINLFYETEKAIVEARPPNSFTLQDLVRDSNLPGYAKRWLRNSKMTLKATDEHILNDKLHAPGRWKSYQLTIILPNGISCKADFEADKSMYVLPGPHRCE